MAATLGTEGETLFGTPQTRGIVGAAASTRGTNLPGMLHLQTYNGSSVLDFYLWVDTTGDLRISNAIPSDQDADGSVIGSQS